MNDLLTRINQVFQDVFDDDSIELTPETTAEDIEGWDSVMHVNLILKLEKVFKVKFGSSEVASLKNVGDLVNLIGSRLGTH